MRALVFGCLTARAVETTQAARPLTPAARCGHAHVSDLHVDHCAGEVGLQLHVEPVGAPQTITGHNDGAARWDRSNGSVRVALVTSVLYCGAIQLGVALFPGWVGQAFVDDPATIAEVVRLLPIMAHRLGYRDWNALHAVIGVRAPGRWVPGGRVRGRYVSQPFEASVVSSSRLRPGGFRLALELDEPVDVVRFESFSNLRKRIQCVVGPSGTTREKTSDGQPHVVLEMRL